MAYLFLLKTYWHYAGKNRFGLVLSIFFHVVSISAQVGIPYAIPGALNTIQKYPKEQIVENIIPWIFLWVSLSLAFNVFHRIGRYFEFRTGYRAKQRFLTSHYHILTRLPLSWHADHHSGDVINRLKISADALYNFATGQMTYVKCFVAYAGPLIMLYFLNPRISVLAFVISVIALLVIRVFDKILVKYFRQVNQIEHKISAILFDFVSNMRTIIIVKLGAKTEADYTKKIADGYHPVMYLETWVNALKWFFISVFNLTLQISVVFYYIYLQLKTPQMILVGNAAAVFQYLNQMSGAFTDVSREIQKLLEYKTNLEEIRQISDASYQLPPQISKPKWQTLAVQGLTFAYPHKKAVLTNIGLEIFKGQKIALTGESGSGKSTLMYLLRGLYEPQKGSLTINGKKACDLKTLGTMTTLMPQDPEIFENTIEYNITMGLSYPKSAVKEALRISCFDKVLSKLPEGLATDIREKGVNLSGGERQRLALARNILAAKDSDIILMDEATSSIDMKNEKEIFQNILSYFKDKTIIASIHRLYLTDLFDVSYHMQNGVLSASVKSENKA